LVAVSEKHFTDTTIYREHKMTDTPEDNQEQEKPRPIQRAKDVQLFLVDTLDRPYRVELTTENIIDILGYINVNELSVADAEESAMFMFYLLLAWETTSSLPSEVRDKIAENLYHHGITKDAKYT